MSDYHNDKYLVKTADNSNIFLKKKHFCQHKLLQFDFFAQGTEQHICSLFHFVKKTHFKRQTAGINC